MCKIFSRKSRADVVEHEKMARLENADRDLQQYQERASRAINALDSRHGRNHWRESIEQMIQGA